METKFDSAFEYDVECMIFRAKLSERACEINQQFARQAAQRIQKCQLGNTISIPDIWLDRLAGCCQCEKMQDENLREIYEKALTRNVTVLVERVLEEGPYTHDEEEQREKELEKYRRYYNKKTQGKRFWSLLHPSASNPFSA